VQFQLSLLGISEKNVYLSGEEKAKLKKAENKD
jgi:hypothetical protein